MFYGTLIFIHIVVSFGLIMAVLLQSGKGGGLAGTFGGSGITGGIFGGRGAAPFLTKATTVFAILFMLSSLTLSYIGPRTSSSESVLERTLGPAPGSEPAVMSEMPVAPESTLAVPGEMPVMPESPGDSSAVGQ